MSQTFLELVNSARIECGSVRGGDDLTTLTGLVGTDLKIKRWVSKAWMDVQRKHPTWLFLRSSFSFPTVAGTGSYASSVATNFGKWLPDTFRIYVTATGLPSEIWLEEWDWDSFRNTYLFGTQRTVQNKPVIFSIAPNKSVYLGPLPDATGYTVTGDYYTRAIELSADGDIPSLPDQFVDIIIHKTKMYYGQFQSAAEVFQSGKADFDRMMSELENDQLPHINLGGPLA